MKKLRWLRFLLILIFYSIPRVMYVIKFLLPKEPECKDGYQMYANLAQDVESILLHKTK